MDNPFLKDNFRPVREEIAAGPLAVTGSVPGHLDGRYLRIGPNPIAEVDPDHYHWFLGDGMVHGVRLRDGQAEWYRNRYVRSSDTARRLGEPPPERQTRVGIDASPNTNVIGQGGRTLALVEGGPLPYELTDELDTIGACDFDGTLQGGYTAHPHLDPATGELHAVSYLWAWGKRVRYTVLGTDGKVRRTVDIEVAAVPMMHDFSLTEHYVVLYDLPVTFNTARAVSQLPRLVRPLARWQVNRALSRPAMAERLVNAAAKSGGGRARYDARSFPYIWNPRHQARIGVMPRDGGSADVRWFELNPCFVFHPLNAYEADGTLVLDVVRHERMFSGELRGPGEDTPTLDRWTVDLAAGKVLESRLDDRGQEFPRIDERLTGHPHRYGYTVNAGSDENYVIKHDFAKGESTVRTLEAGRQTNEFSFVPDRPDAAEDEGTLIGYVYNPETGRSDLVLLDAGTLEDVATIHLPARVPQGFHGNWIPATVQS
jgi:carotenoid cleavage dioxygenase